MSRLAYVNGRFLRQAEAGVSIEDRGYQLGDGVYEVWAVMDGKLADAEGHFARLERSLGEISIPMPMSRAALTVALRETVRRNRVRYGIVYLQVTRGVARRDHAFPGVAVAPTVVITARSGDAAAAEARAAVGVSVITRPDDRWARCDIKTVNLLPNVLAKQAAKGEGAFEAWLVDKDGLVTEGASSNAWIVDANGVLRTRDTGANILRGVTRLSLIDVAREAGYTVEERPFTVAEAKAAREAFLTGAGALVMPIVRIDDSPVANGHPGEVATALRSAYIRRAVESAI
ncbi:MAG: D-amino-acid transaminase [Caulobacteraceae bacterium]|nr:D-amino-acid transaminase [Caulobacteraceae bacterium]